MSFVMPIIICIIVMLMYLGFYVNDRVVLEEAVKEAAVYACANYPSDKSMALNAARQKYEEITYKRLYCVENINFNVSVKTGYIVATADCNFKIPILNKFSKQIMPQFFNIKAYGKGSITNPVNKIWLVEIMESVINRGDN